FSSRRRHTRFSRDWSSDVCSSDLVRLTETERAGLSLADMDLIELNEAFAVQVIACLRELGLGEADHERINVNGSGISLGHPIGRSEERRGGQGGAPRCNTE